jgi:hypothetical protein
MVCVLVSGKAPWTVISAQLVATGEYSNSEMGRLEMDTLEEFAALFPIRLPELPAASHELPHRAAAPNVETPPDGVLPPPNKRRRPEQQPESTEAQHP